MAASTFVNKYALRDNKIVGNDDGAAVNFVESTPDDMHLRLASELARKDVEYYAKKKIAPTDDIEDEEHGIYFTQQQARYL
ncbi:hypothetical protein, partial [Streptomyces caniscabiei]|uniref:hypothetical protein n=1 Tax=Streptomyces caniscabiei TaxID=2746961 RepID=UPI0038F80F0C